MTEPLKSDIEEDYRTLCAELNMDEETKEVAWHSYNKTIQNYTLEGNKLHWLACALYVACRKSSVPTVGAQQMLEGNGVSLTRLLRNSKLSLIEFFDKVKKWADMTNLKQDMVEKIEKLQRNFSTSYVIFKKYQPIFSDVFKDLNTATPRPKTSRKQKRTPCTVAELFDFTWTLFIRVKSVFSGISDDLVNSYHLLLTCLDYVHANAYLDNRNDLLKEARVKTEDGASDLGPVPCILDKLCSSHDGIPNEVKSIREHYLKPFLKRLFDERRLRGDEENLCGILDKDYFDQNLKTIRKEYEAYVLNIGEYDERVFLGEGATVSNEIGTPTKVNVTSHRDPDLAEKLGVARRNLTDEFGSSLIPSTPLSGRRYMQARDNQQQMLTPITNATYLVSRLHKMLAGQSAKPSAELLEIFNKFNPKIADNIEDKLNILGLKFTEAYTAPSKEGHPGSLATFAAHRLSMGRKLFYRILEKIILMEQKTQKSLGAVLEHDMFIQAVFSATLEIVMSSYNINSQGNFTWILNTFNLEAYQFYKVIEIIIRAEDGLARDMVKHLQGLEESILESQAWVSSSSVWEAVKLNSGDHAGVPTCEDVSLPSHDTGATNSPVSHHRSYQIRSPMTGERFRSPVVSAVARRQLFSVGQDASSSGDARISILPNSTVTGRSVLASSVTGSPGHVGLPQTVPGSPMSVAQSITHSPMKHKISVVPVATSLNSGITMRTPGKADGTSTQHNDGGRDSSNLSVSRVRPRRTGPLALFLRKVYSLAHIRLEALCTSMQIHDEELRRKIWTSLEHTLVNHIHLMMDRHLDQLIMCSLYIVCKVSGKQFEKNFTDIMKHYRNQPQCASHVYRSVLLHKRQQPPPAAAAAAKLADVPSTNSSTETANKPPPTPTRMANSSTVGADGMERGDLIMFYNTVFMEKVQEFALRFRRQANLPPLSPLPMLRAVPASPCRKVSENHSLYVRALKLDNKPTAVGGVASAVGGSSVGNGLINNPFTSPLKPRALSYNFSSSPAKDLDAINQMVKSEGRKKVGKRLLIDDGDDTGDQAANQPKILRPSGDPTKPNKMLDFLINERSSLKT